MHYCSKNILLCVDQLFMINGEQNFTVQFLAELHVKYLLIRTLYLHSYY